MKVRRKSDGEIINVEAIVYNAKNGERYSPSELDFNLDAEDTVIQGWVAKDADVQWVYLYSSMPTRGINMWNGHGSLLMPLDSNLFTDLTWDDDPIEVELTIKRKKK